MEEGQTPSINYNYHLTCSKCDHTIPVKSEREIKLLVCPNCYFIDGSKISKDYSQIRVDNNKKKLIIKLGARGLYNDRSFQVIGAIIKSEKAHYFTNWWEYCLQYDDDGTIFFLSVWNGHFTIYERMSVDLPVLDQENFKKSIEYKGESFEYFDTYGYTTDFAVGAFPYDIVDVRGYKIFDYINPPHLISFEVFKSTDTTCFMGTYLYPKQVGEIFSNPALALSNRKSVAPAQPFYGGINMKYFNRISLIFLACFILLSIFVFTPDSTRSLVYKTLNFEESTIRTEFVSPSFTLKDKLTPYFLSFSADAYVDNNWVELQFSLINEQTGAEKEVALGIEYYSGVDDGYSWSEGSQSSETFLSNVEPGRYHVKATMLKPPSNLISEVRFAVRTDSPMGWNFRIVVIPLGLLIILMNLLQRQFNRIKFGEIDTLFGNQ